MPRIIRKKTWPLYFEKILSGEKTYDFRLADFDVEPDDEIVFAEWDPETRSFTGREIAKRIGFIGRLENLEAFWPRDEIERHGCVIMSLQDPDRGTPGGG